MGFVLFCFWDRVLLFLHSLYGQKPRPGGLGSWVVVVYSWTRMWGYNIQISKWEGGRCMHCSGRGEGTVGIFCTHHQCLHTPSVHAHIINSCTHHQCLHTPSMPAHTINDWTHHQWCLHISSMPADTINAQTHHQWCLHTASVPAHTIPALPSI